MALLDFMPEAGSDKAMRMEGLLGGLQQFGAGLAQAGQMRPLGQPGPGLADAFTGFDAGRRQGLLQAYQQKRWIGKPRWRACWRKSVAASRWTK